MSDAWRSVNVEHGPDRPPGALREELAAANRRAEDALLEAASARDEREALERRNAELGESLREQRATRDELELWRGELERRLASMSTELGDARARLRAEQAKVSELTQRLEAAGLRGDSPQAADIDLEELSRRAALDAGERAARELAEAVADQARAGL